MARQHKISHKRRILYEQTLQENYLLPGMIVTFNYDKPDVYDRRPLLFFMYKEKSNIHGINLNYLHESRVQKLFKLGQSLTPVWEENLLGLRLPYTRLQLSNPRAVTSVDSKLLYRTVMPRDIWYQRAYRTYSLGTASAMKVVNYKLDVISEKVGRRASETVSKRKNIKQELGDNEEIQGED